MSFTLISCSKPRMCCCWQWPTARFDQPTDYQMNMGIAKLFFLFLKYVLFSFYCYIYFLPEADRCSFYLSWCWEEGGVGFLLLLSTPSLLTSFISLTIKILHSSVFFPAFSLLNFLLLMCLYILSFGLSSITIVIPTFSCQSLQTLPFPQSSL